jgi:hypothetical protein
MTADYQRQHLGCHSFEAFTTAVPAFIGENRTSRRMINAPFSGQITGMLGRPLKIILKVGAPLPHIMEQACEPKQTHMDTLCQKSTLCRNY